MVNKDVYYAKKFLVSVPGKGSKMIEAENKIINA